MIKKIVIENYGSFKKIETNLGDTYPTFIVGLNDVGKTAFLHAMWALRNGVDERYLLSNGDKKKMKIQITLAITDKHYYDWKQKDNFIESFGKIFEGDLIINIDIIRGRKNKISFEDLKCGPIARFIEEKILKKIKEFVHKKNIKLINIDSLNDENIEEISGFFKITKTNKEKGKKLLSLFKNFKEFLFKMTNKIHFLKLHDEKEWDFIKEKYSLRDLEENWFHNKIGSKKTLLEIVKTFAPKHYEKFNNIISSDVSVEKINNNVGSISNAIAKKINDFLETFFPSTNTIECSLQSWIDNETNFHVMCWKMKDFCEEISEEIMIPVNKRSEGFKWFLKLYYIITKAKKYDVILIDEPEKFLHIKTQEQFLKFVKKFIEVKKIKFIFATHSPWIISDKQGLDILRTDNICFLQKENGRTKVFNFNQILKNKTNKENKELVSLINTALGFNYFEFMKLSDKKEIIFVEGYADIFLWQFACKILQKKSDYYEKFRFWPLYNDNKFYNIGLANALNLKYKVLLDGERQKWEKKNPKIDIDPKKLVFLGDELKEQNIINPEDILNDQKKEKYGFGLKVNTHFLSWKQLSNDYKINKEEFFDENEIKKFKYYFSVVNKIFNQNTEVKKFSILNTINEVDNNINNKTLKEEK